MVMPLLESYSLSAESPALTTDYEGLFPTLMRKLEAVSPAMLLAIPGGRLYQNRRDQAAL